MNIMLLVAGGDIGGGKTHILSLAKQLSTTNNVLVFSLRSGVLTDEARDMGLAVTISQNGWNARKDIRNLKDAIDSFHPDVVHCHGAKANMYGALLKLYRDVPVITTVHSDPKLDYMGQPHKQYTYGLINELALKRMDFYMAVADRMELTLIERGKDPQSIFTIYNGIDFSTASPDPRPSKPEGDLVVGIAARLNPVKDIATLVKAFAKAYGINPRLFLSIAGTGEDEAMLRQMAKDLGVEHRVRFEGWVSNMQEYFAGVDINVLSSVSETFPYSLLEGAYHHCPAIASRVGGIPTLIKHGETGFLFEKGDVDSFAEYIYQLSVDEDLRRTLAENLFEKAKNEFSLDRMKEVQEEAYRTILRRKQHQGQRRGAVLCGAYGRGNAGDEAILKGILNQLSEIDPDMPYWVMSRNPKETRLTHKVNSLYLFNVFQFWRKLRKSQLFVNGGGSLMQDVTSSRSLMFYLFTLKAAKLSGCKIIMYGCGIGPITKEANKKIAARVLNNTPDAITLRDSSSKALLDSMGVDKPEISLSADPTVNLGRASEAKVRGVFLAENIPAEEKKIGFCLRNWKTPLNEEAVIAAAEYAYNKYGLTPVFVPIETPRDAELGQKICDRLNVPGYACQNRYTVEELIGMLGSMELVVGMRLHSLIFATAGGTPVVGISYDVKVDSFIKDIGSKYCIPMDELTADGLIRYIDAVMAQPERRAEEAQKRLQAMEHINRDAAKRLLQAEGGK
ncbi:MAG: polysaccharide pyruvyl transferase CsaB [Firmicutes bacterium]|nr:polysaccharide pyruvyl transferase CsaB [Bacillota bacterium]